MRDLDKVALPVLASLSYGGGKRRYFSIRTIGMSSGEDAQRGARFSSPRVRLGLAGGPVGPDRRRTRADLCKVDSRRSDKKRG